MEKRLVSPMVLSGLAIAALLAIVGGAAQAACEGQVITSSRGPTLDFYDQSGKVILTMRDKSASNSLNLPVKDCDAEHYYIFLPGHIPAAVSRRDVVVGAAASCVAEGICSSSSAEGDVVRRGGNGCAQDGDTSLCKE